MLRVELLLDDIYKKVGLRIKKVVRLFKDVVNLKTVSIMTYDRSELKIGGFFLFKRKSKKLMIGIFLGVMLAILTGCKGSEDIQGEWYAENSEGKEIVITLTDDSIIFSSDGSDDWNVPYKQTGTGFKNNISYKKIEFDDKSYSFVFPDKKDKNNAVILIPNDEDEATEGMIYWVLSRNDFPDYNTYK